MWLLGLEQQKQTPVSRRRAGVTWGPGSQAMGAQASPGTPRDEPAPPSPLPAARTEDPVGRAGP